MSGGGRLETRPSSESAVGADAVPVRYVWIFVLLSFAYTSSSTTSTLLLPLYIERETLGA